MTNKQLQQQLIDKKRLSQSSFNTHVAPSSMLFMCLLLCAVFTFGWPSLINKVHAVVELDSFEVFEDVCARDMCLNFGWTP